MELLDLCPLETWKSLEDDIHDRTGLDASVFNVQGIRIIPSEKWSNRLCPAIKGTSKGQSFICAAAHMNIAILAKSSGEPVIEECDAGLIKLVVPIFVDKEFVGSVSGCGMLLGDGEVDTFLVHKTTDLQEDILDDLSADIPSISVEKAEELALYIKDRVRTIVVAYQESAP